MKSIKLFIPILLLFILACEDPIDVPVAPAETQVAVDAFINDQPEIQTISLTETRPLFQAEAGNTIQDATVEVVNNTSGETLTFNHSADGVYTYDPIANGAIGNIGDDFTLNVVHANNTYSATSTLNPVPPVDSIQQEFRTDEIFGGDGIYCQFFARDLPGLGNTYWIKTMKNDTFLNRPFEINLAYDAGFTSGAEIDNVIFIPPIRALVNPVDDDGLSIVWNVGDKVEVEIHSLTNKVFEFMEIGRDQLINGQNGIFAEPVANAVGNIVNTTGSEEILGVFNVASVSSLERIIE